MDNNYNNANYTKQLTLDFNSNIQNSAQVKVLDFKVALENKANSKKERAISALLKEAELITW